VTDTVIMKDVRAAMVQLNETVGTAGAMVNDLKETSQGLKTNKNTPAGVLLHDEETAASLKTTFRNLETSSVKLDENLEALQHNFLFRRYFKKKSKKESQALKDSTEAGR
jgi:phospholipid/cholesterol/gamma-HCH transport system substrate-binding protein